MLVVEPETIPYGLPKIIFRLPAPMFPTMALEKAKAKASKANVKCEFMLIDFLRNKIEGIQFGFIFDRGCFHSFSSEDDRKKFAKNAAIHLEKVGLWLTIVGNADEDRQGPGPPQRTAKDIVVAVEPYFEILSLKSSYFGSNRPNPPRAWRCLMRKRGREVAVVMD